MPLFNQGETYFLHHQELILNKLTSLKREFEAAFRSQFVHRWPLLDHRGVWWTCTHGQVALTRELVGRVEFSRGSSTKLPPRMTDKRGPGLMRSDSTFCDLIEFAFTETSRVAQAD